MRCRQRFAISVAVGMLVSVLAAGSGRAQPETATDLWEEVRASGRAILKGLKERARPRWQPGGGQHPKALGLAVDEQPVPGAEAWSPPDVEAPTFSRITIEPRGATAIEGKGTPGSRVELRSAGRVVGTATADANGRWTARLQRPLLPGVHRIDSSVQVAHRGATVAGSDLRLSIPERMPGSIIVGLNGSGAWIERDPVRDLAEALARDANERFSEIMPKDSRLRTAGQDSAPKSPDRERAVPAVDDSDSALIRWLERSAKEYQDAVIKKRSLRCRIGDGAGALSITTHNGDVHIR